MFAEDFHSLGRPVMNHQNQVRGVLRGVRVSGFDANQFGRNFYAALRENLP